MPRLGPVLALLAATALLTPAAHGQAIDAAAAAHPGVPPGAAAGAAGGVDDGRGRGPSGRTDYYATVDASSPETLRATLHEIIDDHQRFPYTDDATDTWDILNAADEDPDNPANILDVYKNASYLKIGGGTGVYNREHSWPNSYGFPDDDPGNYPYTDCHHLFASDTAYNANRGRMPFRWCSSGCTEWATVANNGTGGEPGTGYPGYSNWSAGSSSSTTGIWETWIGRRGDIARAQLYLDVRYEGGVHGVTGAAEPDLVLTDDGGLIAASATGANEAVAYMGELAVLLSWHWQDPPDDLERRRNEVVFSFQGNRNPFIDHPEWVACVFEGLCDAPLFADGFDAGGTGAWSATVGGP